MSKLNLHFFKRQPKGNKSGTRPMPGMVPNNAGGFGFEVNDWIKLRRFLVLGSEGGTYYVGEAKLTIENAQAVERLLRAEPIKVVRQIVEISKSGRSAKNDACLFALAMVAGLASADGRAAALAVLPEVARTGTHLFTFVEYVQSFRGWGRGLRRAIARWYEVQPPEKLAVQLTKYQQRNGWSHRDLLRLAHPKAEDAVRNGLYRFAVTGSTEGLEDSTVLAFQKLRQCENLDGAATAKIVEEARLSMEMVPAELRYPEVYRVLAKQAGLEWLLRNLGNLSRVAVLSAGDRKLLETVCQRLNNQAGLDKARLHPLKILAALAVYRSGSGVRGSGRWNPEAAVVDALDEAFYKAFKYVTPTGKRLCLGLDVSGSMAGTTVNGIAGLTAREACGAMALVTAKSERPSNVSFVAFDTKPYHLALSANQRLDDVVNILSRTGGGGTDCAIPIQWARKKKVPVDVFVIYTDSETWAGDEHPLQALNAYGEAMGIDAKLVTVAMAANRISLADCTDKRMLNVVGFDTVTPELISQFVMGDL